MTKTLTFHIGCHKTGSSSIQEYCQSNRHVLAEADIDYLNSSIKDESDLPGHQNLAWAYMNNEMDHMVLEHPNSDIIKSYQYKVFQSSKSKILISSEDFSLSFFKEPQIEQLKNDFKDYTCQIIAFVREPLDLLASLYYHNVRLGHTDDPFEIFIQRPDFQALGHYDQQLKMWIKCFGQSQVLVHKYHRNSNSVNDFFSMLYPQFHYENNDPPIKANKGIHPFLTRVFQDLNKHQNSLGVDKCHSLKSDLMALSESMPSINAAEYYLSQATKNTFEKKYGPCLTFLRKTYGINFK